MRRVPLLVLFALLVIGVGCGSTLQRSVEEPKRLGFLAKDEHRLQPGAEGQAALVFVKEGVDWSGYEAILLDPVQYWDDPEDPLDPDVEQMLTTYLYSKLSESLAEEGFRVAALPGPGVLRAQLALLDASASTPVLRSVSLVVPIGLVLNTAQRLVTDSYTFSGQIQAAMRVSDSQTGEVVAAALDRRSGGANLERAVQWQWGDAKAAIDLWSERFTKRLRELHDRLAPK
jgi:hypothetical protein